MKHAAASLLACAFLMGCESGSNPLGDTAATTTTTTTTGTTTGDGTTGGTGTDTGGTTTGGTTGGSGSATVSGQTNAIPAAIAGNVTNVSFNQALGTLTVTGINLDNVPVSTTYTRTPSLDRNGFVAFTSQDDPLDRHFTAYAGQTGNVRAGVVSSPSPRNRNFKGVFFERDGAYDPPPVSETSGLVTYAGTYVGLTNISDPNGTNLLSNSVSPSELQPGQALIIEGDVFLNADFADNSVEGNIFNRELLNTDLTSAGALPSLVLIVSSIDSDGNFNGTVEYDVRDPLSNTTAFVDIGTYAGTFGGINSSEVAGGINLTEFDGVGNQLGYETELESGIFLLNRCGALANNPVCNQIP